MSEPPTTARGRIWWNRPDLVARYLGGPPISPVLGFVIGTAAAILSILLRFAATPYIGDGEALLTAFPLVLTASLAAGRLGGWTCLLLCTLASWYLFIGDAFSFSFGPHEEGILIGTFLTGAFTIEISVALRRTFREILSLRATERLLSHELEHRIKNTLTLVVSIARQTFRSARSPDVAFADFEGRMMALAAAQDIAAKGSAEPAHISQIVQRSLQPFCGTAIGQRLTLDGPDLAVDNDTTVALFLVFHELSTNAAKYGALSSDTGTVHVAWRVDETRRLALHWRERGGPPVTPPSREGFGTKLTDRICARSLKGSIAFSYDAAGVEAGISAMLPQ